MTSHDVALLAYWTFWSGFCFGVGCLFARWWFGPRQPTPLTSKERQALKKLAAIDKEWR